MDFTFDDLKYQQDLMDDFGITLSYDSFGQDQYFNNIYLGMAGVTDRERIRAIAAHVHSGYVKQLLMSCDVCEKIHLRKYGGFGYSKILEHVLPLMKLAGVNDKEIRTMMVENPRAILAR
jgi:phosphotriesterase-related protein